MSDNPRSDGHPSDIPSSRYTGGTAHNPVSIRSESDGNNNNNSSRSPNSGNHTRNVIIGSIATIIASTSVYYLTQYVNNKKSNDSPPSFLVQKEATINAWNRYVTMDNIYYKAVQLLSKDNTILDNPDKYMVEVEKENEIFKNDAGKIANEKYVDPGFKTLLKRRLDRQNDFIQMIKTYISNVKAIVANNKDAEIQNQKLNAEITPLLGTIKRHYEKSSDEIENLCKTLSLTFATTFDPYEINIYKDYKNGITTTNFTKNNSEVETSPDKNMEQVKEEDIVGSWKDDKNSITLNNNGILDYSLANGEYGSGVWKIENNKLKTEFIRTNDQTLLIAYFSITDIKKGSFTMTLDSPPFDVYHFKKVN